MTAERPVSAETIDVDAEAVSSAGPYWRAFAKPHYAGR